MGTGEPAAPEPTARPRACDDRSVVEPDPVNASFVGGPLDGETHLLAHRLPYVQVPGPGETFFARLLIDPPDAPDHLVYEIDREATVAKVAGEDTLVYRCRATVS